MTYTSSPEHQSSSSSDHWVNSLHHLPREWALLPLNGNKQPFDPSTGFKIADWASKPGWDASSIVQLSPDACGVILGPVSGGLLAVDFDGPGSEECFQKVFGRPSTELPTSIAWTSGRPERRQVAFTVGKVWWNDLCGLKTFKNAEGSTVLELRWKGHQSAIAGTHPQTPGYHWLPGCSPQELRNPAFAPDWLLYPLLQCEKPLKPCNHSEHDVDRALDLLAHIPADQFAAYVPWLSVGMALHSVDAGLLHSWIDWSRPMPSFDEQECIEKWNSFGKSSSQLTIGSLHYWAECHGYRMRKRNPSTLLIHPKGRRGGDVGKVSWMIEGFLAKGATTLLASEAGAGKTSLLMHAAAAVEEGSLFLGEVPTTKGDVLFIQGDEPQRDSEDKQRLMGLEGAFDICYVHEHLEPEDLVPYADTYDLIIIDSATSLLTKEGSYHEDPTFTSRLYGLQEIISSRNCSCIITSHLRKSADGAPRKFLTEEDIAGRSTIRNALQDLWGLMRCPEPRWPDHYSLLCFGKRYCSKGEIWELQGDPESYWWGLESVKDGLSPQERRLMVDKLMEWLNDHPEPMTSSGLAGVLAKDYEHVRRVCKSLYAQGKLKRTSLQSQGMGRPQYAYSLP